MQQKFLARFILCAWIAGMGSGCGSWSAGKIWPGGSIRTNSPDVQSGVAVHEVYLTVPDSLEKAAWMETFLWTVKCEAMAGEICSGSPTLLIPPDKTLCRHEYKIMAGSEGNTEQVIRAEKDSSLTVNIRAVGGPDWNPYKSKLVIQVRAVGITKEADPETLKVLNCKSLSLAK